MNDLNITAKVRPIANEKGTGTVGFADITINDAFVVKGFTVVQGEKGLFVGEPSQQNINNETGEVKYYKTAKPITAEARVQLTNAVLLAYEKEINKAQNIAKTGEKTSLKEQLSSAKSKSAEQAPKEGKDTKAKTQPER